MVNPNSSREILANQEGAGAAFAMLLIHFAFAMQLIHPTTTVY